MASGLADGQGKARTNGEQTTSRGRHPGSNGHATAQAAPAVTKTAGRSTAAAGTVPVSAVISSAAMLERAGWTVRHQQRYGTLDPYVLWWLGRQERLGRSVRGDLAPRFASFVAGKVAAMPLTMLQRWLPLGVQLTVAYRAE